MMNNKNLASEVIGEVAAALMESREALKESELKAREIMEICERQYSNIDRALGKAVFGTQEGVEA